MESGSDPRDRCVRVNPYARPAGVPVVGRDTALQRCRPLRVPLPSWWPLPHPVPSIARGVRMIAMPAFVAGRKAGEGLR